MVYAGEMATKRKDFTQVAFDVVQRATGEKTAPAPSEKPERGRKAVTAKKTISPKRPPR